MLLYRKRCLHESQRKTFWWTFAGSSISQIFFKISILKNFVNFTFSIKFKTDSNTGVFSWNCREREPYHVMKTAYIEELRTCPEKHRVYHVTKSFYLPRRFMLHNSEEIEWPSNLVHIVFFVNFTSDGDELYVNGC